MVECQYRSLFLHVVFLSSIQCEERGGIMCKYLFLAACGLVVLTASDVRPLAEPTAPEPGPENGGLRLRLVVSPRADSKEGYDVRVDVLNATDRPVTVRANWPYEDDKGNLKDHIEAFMTFETYPPIVPMTAQTIERQRRKSPQPEQVLAAGEALSVKWQTNRRRLIDPPVRTSNWGPEAGFPVPCLYSVHATVPVSTGGAPVLLRSNEQLVSVGWSREMSRHTYGSVLYSYPDQQKVMLNLGALHKVQMGDQFEINKWLLSEPVWKLTITRVEAGISEGTVELICKGPRQTPEFPQSGRPAVLIMKKATSKAAE